MVLAEAEADRMVHVRKLDRNWFVYFGGAYQLTANLLLTFGSHRNLSLPRHITRKLPTVAYNYSFDSYQYTGDNIVFVWNKIFKMSQDTGLYSVRRPREVSS